MKLIIIISLFFILFCNTAMADDWKVTWEPIKESIVDKEYGIAVQNLQDVKRDVNISSFFAETNFDISKLIDVKFYEWKLIPYNYTVNHYDEIKHSDYSEINGTWNNWTESVLNYTETVESEKLDWKSCKSQLFKEDGKTKEDNYGFINIPKLGSKPKDDGTYNGTKLFKLTFKTPIIHTKLTFKTPIIHTDNYGSSGKVALLLDGEEHHPYWNTSWSTQEEIILTGGASGAQTDYQLLLNVTWESGMQTNFDDLRFCNDTDEIDSWLESKVDSSYALIWVEFPTTPANGVEQTYYMYYGNAGAASDWDGAATFIGFDNIADGNTTNGPLISTTTNFASSDYARSDGYSAKYTGADGYYINTTVWSSALSLDNHIVSFWIYFTATASRRATLGSSDSAGVNKGIFLKFENGIVYRYVSSYADTGMTFTSGWNQVEWIPGAAITPMRMNGGSWVNVDHQATLSEFKQIWQVSASDLELDYFDEYLARKYAANPPTYVFSSESYYAGTIHYNTTNPYNHTIDSNDVIAVNRTIIASDDIGWTAAALTDDCHLVVTEYNLTDVIIANFSLYTASLDWLTVTNLSLYTNYNLLFSNGTLIESQITNGNGIAYFTTNLSVGSYIIEKRETEHPFLKGALQFFDEMKSGLTDFRNSIGRYLVWGIIFFGVGLAFTIFAKIKQALIGGK